MQKLFSLTKTIEQISKAQPNVNQVVVGDIYQLNTIPDVRYNVIGITQNSHRQDDEYIYYSFNIFYVDRLLDDESNRLDIQSSGIVCLNQILTDLEGAGAIIGEKTFTTFNERFADLCAGVYVTVEIQVENLDCDTHLNIVTSVNGKTGDVIIEASGSTEECAFIYDKDKKNTIDKRDNTYSSTKSKQSVFGTNNTVDASGARVIGSNNTVSGNISTTIGDNNTNLCSRSTVIGSRNTTDNSSTNGDIIVGRSNTSTNKLYRSIMVGEFLKDLNDTETSTLTTNRIYLGSFNDPDQTFGDDEKKAMFQIGIGGGVADRVNALSITVDGNVYDKNGNAFITTAELNSLPFFSVNLTYTNNTAKTFSFVDSIPYRRFRKDTTIKTATIDDNCNAIIDEAFNGCSNLQQVKYHNITYVSIYSLEQSLKSYGVHLGENVFDGTKMTSYKAVITLSDGSTETVRFSGSTIGDRAFYGRTDIESLKLEGITSVGLSCFNGCTNLSSLDLGTIVTIKSGAFVNCPSLTAVTIPDTCTKLGDSTCFSQCTGLVSITIPTSVTKLGSQAFEGCTSLTDVYYGGTIEQWVAIEKQFSTFRDFNVTVHCTDGNCDKNGTPKA